MSTSGGKHQAQMKQFFPAKDSKTPGSSKSGPAPVGKNQMRISSFFSKGTPPSTAGGPAAEATPAADAAKQQPTPAPASAGIAQQPQRAKSPTKDGYAVGQRVRVFWPAEESWFKGTIQAVNKDDGKYQVVYDDGDVQWEDLASEKVELLPADSAPKPAKTNKAKASKPDSAANKTRMDEDGLEDEGVTVTLPGSSASAPRRRLKQGASQPAKGSKGKAAKGKQPQGSDDDMEEDEQDGLEDSESEFEAGNESGSDDESVDLEDEEEGGSDGETAAAGSKRKRATAKTPAAKARPAAKKQAAAATVTPAPGRATPTPFGSVPTRTPAPASAASAPARTPSTTPQTGARLKLHKSLDITPATAGKSQDVVKEVVHGVETKLSNEDAGRFLARMAQRFPFLHPSSIMDAQKRKPTHPDYDPTTLYVPPNWFKDMKISEGQQQWWNFKVANFDSVLLFKMGKFYEMFEMDAYVGVDVLGLMFMKGDQPHAGFPEVRYHDMAEALARAGYRVVVVEQTETPEQLARRNEERKSKGMKVAGVVNREKVAVVSKGTMIDAEMVASKPDPSYVMAVVELPPPADRSDLTLVTCLGVAAVDVASGHVMVGEFLDDEVRSCLRTHLTALQPVELVLPSKQGVAAAQAGGAPHVDPVTIRVLRNALRDPRINAGKRAGGWEAQRLLQLVQDRRYFKPSAAGPGSETNQSFAGWPPVLRSLACVWTDSTTATQDGSSAAAPGDAEAALQPGGRYASGGEAALGALCGLVDFLKDSLLDLAVMPQGRMDALPVLLRASSSSGAAAPTAALGSDEPVNMLLNGAALENLEILENADGGVAGSLLSVVDSCSTPFGRRRLRTWLCRPLYRAADIIRRQDAVAVLSAAADAVGTTRRQMAGVSDLERSVARLYSSTVAGASGRDASNVVLYEDAAKRKVKALTAAIRDLQAVARAAQGLRSAVEAAASGGGVCSHLLQQLTDADKWSAVEDSLAALQAAADWRQAEATGRVVPAEGVHEAYDEAFAGVVAAEAALAVYLKEVRPQLPGVRERDVQYVSMNKESHVIEVPESTKVPRSFTLVGQRKGFKKYTSEELGELVASLAEASAHKEEALSRILQDLVIRFCDDRDLWRWAVDAVAELDALMSLASHAVNAEGVMCRPEILSTSSSEAPVLEACGLRHPAGLPGRSGAFVPNDIVVGGDAAPAFIVLSGPNMGGKSTLLRQACLAAVLAQVGACVPAESLRITPVDAVFVRMGAKDSIMTGQSTFFVELAETAAMLNKATNRSLVALDELGRGTATLDGAAIASAVLQHMAGTVGCRGLFATHYHHLSTHHAADPRVAIMHMACAVGGCSEEEEGQEAGAGAMEVDGAAADGVQEVTFLYKLTPGACPKSYGTNVARLAGLPAAVVARAGRMSAATEGHVQQEIAAGAAPAADAMQVDGPAAAAAGSAAHVLAAARDVVASVRQALQARTSGGDGAAATRLTAVRDVAQKALTSLA